jgi:hypothetical protein
MDPLSVMAAIGAGLGLVDRFYDLVKKLRGERAGQHSVQVDAANDRLIVNDHGYVQEFTADQIQMSEFDQRRHNALMARIDINWTRFNDIDVERAAASADEKSRLGVQMGRLQEELCKDFREVVGMYESILGVSLPDHYTLYDICR